MKAFLKSMHWSSSMKWAIASCFWALAWGFVTAADEDAMKRNQATPAEEAFITWDTILTSTRRTDGTIICAVFERATDSKVYEYWIGAHQLLGADAELNALRKSANSEYRRTITANKFWRTSFPDGKEWNPGFLCVIIHWPNKERTIFEPIGFATKEEAILFADTYKKAAIFAREKPKR